MGRIFAVLLAAWVLAGVSMAAWLCYSRHAAYESERWNHLDTWCYKRAKLFEQQALTTVSQIHTFAGLASVMGRPREHGQWAWDKCFTQQRWDEYINKTGYARPGNTGGALCLFVTDKERPAFEQQYGGPIVDMAGQPQQRQPLYCPKLLDINYYRGSIPLMDLVQRLPEELPLVRRTGDVVFGAVVPIGNLSFNLTGVPVAGEAVMGAAGSVVDLVSIIRNVLENVFSPDPSITFEAYDTTDPSAPTMIYGPGPRLLFYKERDIAPFTAASPPNATRPWEQRAIVPLDLLGGHLRQYQVWCRYTQPTNAWQSWGVPFLWALLALVLTALVAAVAWQQRVGYQRSQDGLAKADIVRESALAAERSKSQFVASMSHELRTPMIGIMGLLDALADMGLSGAQTTDVEEARATAQETVRLVNRVLDLSKLEARKMALCCGAFNPRDWLETVVRESYWRARQKGIELVGVVDVNVPVELVCDTMRLTQALQELLENALQHTTEGHVLLRVAVCPASMPLEDALLHINASDAPIQPSPPPSPSFFARATRFATTLTTQFTQNLLKPWTKRDAAAQTLGGECVQLVVACEDTGCGFDAAFQQVLFQFKGRTQSGGAGLGLALMHQLGVAVGVLGSDPSRQELTARILSGLGAHVHILPSQAAEALETSQTPLTDGVSSGLGAYVHLLPALVGTRHGDSNGEASREEPFRSPRSLDMIHVGGAVGSSSRESLGKASGGRRLLSSPCQSLSTSHAGEVVESGNGELGGWVMSWFGGKRRKREGEGGERREGREGEEVRESRRWVVVVEEEDVWKVQCAGEVGVACDGALRRVGGEVVCKGAGGESREAGRWDAGGHAWGKRAPVVALVPEGASSWEAAVWQAGVRVVRRMEGMGCVSTVSAVPAVSASSASAPCASAAIAPRVVICHRPLLSHRLLRAIQ
ncbi:unnamed protein product, partial [Closterium sp. Yama58-4]